MPCYPTEDLAKNSAVLVTFTVSKYFNRKQRNKNFPAASCSLNVKELVLLATPELDDAHIQELQEPPSAALDLSCMPLLTEYGRDSGGPSKQTQIARKKKQNLKLESIRLAKENRDASRK
jgi:hypothetical protein